jgi:sugar O-acyltransferase (sialic acid O-acetyltransferase NeuD family)
MATDTLIIFGAKSTALEIAELASLIHPKWNIVHVVGDTDPTDSDGLVRVGQLGNFLKGLGGKKKGILSMADPAIREERRGLMKIYGIRPVTLIHPQTTIASSADIGRGSYIAAGARISVNARIGKHCMINLNATFGHDSVCGVHCVINPGAAISGNVAIGDRVLIGANSFVHQGLAIGDDCQIDAMTHVSTDIPINHMATSRSLKVLPDLGRRS